MSTAAIPSQPAPAIGPLVTSIVPPVVTPVATPIATPADAQALVRPLLVAADGREDVRPAMLVAAAVSARLGAPVRVLAALEPAATPGVDAAPRAPTGRELDRVASVREVMRRRVRESVGGAAWPVDAVLGGPTRTIAASAAEQDAELVLVGAGWNDRSARPLGTERALEVASSGVTPVLAAGPDADGTFRRAVVALDFGPASVRAAELACRLLSPGGTLSLVHVKERLEFVGPAGEAWDALCSGQIAELFRRLIATLRGGGAAPVARDGRVVLGGGAACAGRRDVTIGTVTLVGDPAEELAAYAAQVGADLVAAGTRGESSVQRRFAGSVSADVARRASATLPASTMLVCPAPRTAGELRIAPDGAGTREVLDRTEWRLALDGFWRRNDGRPAVVEVDDPEVGAQPMARGCTLLGASYDPHGRRAELEFGDASDGSRHFTRTMADVRSVSVLTGSDGRDLALRVEHGYGQTLVTFLPDAG